MSSDTDVFSSSKTQSIEEWEFKLWRTAVAVLGFIVLVVWYLLIVDSTQGKIEFFSYAPAFLMVPSIFALVIYAFKQWKCPTEFVIIASLGYLILGVSVLLGWAHAIPHGWLSYEMRAVLPGTLSIFIVVPVLGCYLDTSFQKQLRDKAITAAICSGVLFVMLVYHALVVRVAMLS